MIQSKRIGKYEVGNTIGRGGFSKVKRCVDTTTGQAWAMKIVDKVKLQRDNMVHQLQREIALMKSLRHDHIVQLKDVMQSAHHVYLVLELVAGGELYGKLCASERFEEATGRRYFQQLMMAVLCCHSNGIAHRDIKPQNMLLDDQDNIKVSDFGLSNLQPKGDQDLLTTLCGTPNYVAPEVIAGEGYNGFLADVWSCGVVLFIMLAGKLPFEDENVKALFNKIERGEYNVSRHFSPGAADLISKMLVVKPAKRYTVEQVIAHPWFQVDLDHAKLEASRRHVPQPTDEEERNAVTEAQDPSSPSTGGANLAASTALASSQAVTGLDAFDLIDRMTSSAAMAPMACTNEQEVNNFLGQPRVNSTYFLVDGSALSTQGVADLLNELKGNAKVVNATDIRGFVKVPSGILTYVASVNPTSAPFLSAVEVKRVRGDVPGFQMFAQAIAQALGTRARSQTI